MRTSYGAEVVNEEQSQTKPDSLEELEQEYLAKAREEYERLQRREADRKEQEKQKRIHRLQIANKQRSFEAKARQKQEILDKFVDGFKDLIAIAEEDFALHKEVSELVAEMRAMGDDPTIHVDFMLDGGPMAPDVQRYIERQLDRIMRKWKEGAELTATGIMTAI
jgi:hypothetical protein